MRQWVLAGVITAATALPASAETLRVATSADYPPWESVDAAGEMIGFDIDVGNAICERIEADCEWTNQAYDGLLPALIAGQYDLIISAISITAERRERIDFSIAYAQAPASFGTIGDGFGDLGDHDALAAAMDGKAVGVQGASIFENLVNTHFGDAETRVYQRADQIIADLRTGRLDAAVMEVSAWEEFAAANDDVALTMFGPLLSYETYPELGDGIGIGLAKGSDELRAEVDAAIASLIEDGTIAALAEEWFGYDVSP